MLATSGVRVPPGDAWVHEVKWDGMRALLDHLPGGAPRLTTRTERDVSVAFPELVGATAGPGDDLLLDGEVVAMVDGRPSFAGLADRFHVVDPGRASRLAAASPVTYLAFDLLRLDGEDLVARPWRERRALLLEVVARLDGGPTARIQVPPVYDDGEALLSATAAQGLEGVVSKRVTARYRPGRRSEDWLKFPHRPTTSYVVGGWRPETSGRGLGALMVGEQTPDGLRYRGRVGSGLAGGAGARVAARLDPLTSDDCPFADEVPAVDTAGATWVRPELVVDVASLGVTASGRLRQPSFGRVRPDLHPDDLLADRGTREA